MAGTVDGTFRGDPTLAKTLKAKQDEIDQLRRRLSKLPTAATASTIGMTTVAATMEQDNDFFGGSRAAAASWTVRAPGDSAGSGENGPDIDLVTVAPDVAPVDAGWYSVRLWAELRWTGAEMASAPDAALIWFYHDNSYEYMENTVPVSVNAGRPGSTSSTGLLMSTSAMFYLTAGEWCRVEFWWAGSAAADLGQTRAVLEFTRMG